ncbi:MAG: EAL domain-containing protein [Rhodoferax sp.]|nr:MAG: EAL domain-containing protein [Rhodoferax sp.]
MRIVANEQSIPKVNLFGMLGIALVLTLSLGLFFTWDGAQEHARSLQRIQDSVSAQTKGRLQAELDSAASYLEFTRQRTEDRLRSSIREQVDMAMQIAQGIYQRESARLPAAQVKRQIVEALRPARFYDGRGYYFIDSMQGQFVLLPTAPQLEGKTNLDNRDDRGHYIMRGLIDAARFPDGEGFSRYRWYAPDTPKEMADKLAYVRYFAPYDWLIGTGDYTYKWEQLQKQEVVSRLRGMRFGKTGYVGLIDADGRSLLSNSDPALEGKHFSAMPPAAAGAIEMLYRTALQGGGVVHYTWPDARSGTAVKKTAVVRRVEPWGWTLVAAMEDDEFQAALDHELDLNAAHSVQRWQQLAVALVAAMALGLLGSFAFARWSRVLFRRYRDDIEQGHRALAQSEALFRAVFDNAAIGIALVSVDGQYQQVNQEFCDITGYSASELLAPGFTFQRITHADDLQDNLQGVQRLVAGEAGHYAIEKRYVHKDGSLVWARLATVAVRNPDGSLRFMVAVVHDITARKASEASLQLAASVFRHAREAIMVTDPQGTIIEVNDAFTDITGFSRADALGQTPRILNAHQPNADEIHADMWRRLQDGGYWFGEIWNRRKNGELFAELQTITAVYDKAGRVQHYVSLFSDITQMLEQRKVLERIAHYDALTGLPNRVLLADRLHQNISHCKRFDSQLAVAFLDLDGFKAVNDRLGHEAGDTLLVTLARRMQSVLREGDTLARIGGDEFVVILDALHGAGDCEPVLERLLEAAAQPVSLDNATAQVSASIGVALFPQDGYEPDLLMRHADQAMYQAKQAGKSRYCFFDTTRESAAVSLRDQVNAIREALQSDQMRLFYQPKVNMRTGAVIGVEALIRWQHPQRGLLLPGSFLPAVENHVVSIDIGEWVIRTALAQMAQWRAQGLDVHVSVNVGAQQVQQEHFTQRLAALLAEYPEVPAQHLDLELLETSAFKSMEQVAQTLEQCAALGVGFALDDFGTGYSSLTYLRDLPAQTLKIDQCFVHDMLDNTSDLAIVEGIVGLARVFGRTVVAEGVESRAIGDRLLSIGCEAAQGFGIAPPMPATDYVEWRARWQTQAQWLA